MFVVTLRSISHLTLTLIITIAVSSSPVNSEEPSRGVLPDGRAYRTDESGNQLVDYIAELELSVESLERRSEGLEDDVRAREAEITALRQGVCKGNSAAKIEAASDTTISQSAKCEACPISLESLKSEREAAKQSQQECSSQITQLLEANRQTVSGLEGELARVNTNLQQASASLKEEQGRLKQAQIDWSSERESYRAQLATTTGHSEQLREYQEQIKDLQDRIDQIQKEHADQLSTYRATNGQLEAERDQLIQTVASLRDRSRSDTERLKDSDSLANEVKTLRVSIANQEQQIAELQEMNSKLTQERDSTSASYSTRLASLQSEIEGLKRDNESHVAKIKLNEARAAYYAPRERVSKQGFVPSSEVVRARERAVSELRSEMLSALTVLRRRVETRDQMFSNQRSYGGNLRVSPSRLVSSRGRSIDAISKGISVAGSVRELADLRPDIRELESKVNSDIEIAERMFRNKQ